MALFMTLFFLSCFEGGGGWQVKLSLLTDAACLVCWSVQGQQQAQAVCLQYFICNVNRLEMCSDDDKAGNDECGC